MDIKNSFTIIIALYLLLYVSMSALKPTLMFDDEGTRPFGVGYKHTTIMPLWLCSILLALFSYFIILYGLHIRYNNVFIQ